MTDITPVIPRQPVPRLAVPLVGGAEFDITTEKSEHFVFIVFYRGLHCPICRPYLGDLEAKLPDFTKRGVSVVAGVFRRSRVAPSVVSENGSCQT